MKNLFKISTLLLLLAVSCQQKEIIPGSDDNGNGGNDPGGGTVVVPDTAPIARIVVKTDNGAEVDSKENEDYRPCAVSVDWDGDNAQIQEARAVIRGRGNSTWEWYPKKPYRIKLDNSASMLGMPANRDWVLLADYRDVTHMMNATGFYLARELGLPYTNHIRYATLELNGEEMGLYAVTEQVEEGGNRVKLDKEDGILLALDLNDGPGDVPDATNNFWSDVFRMAAAVKYPSDATTADRDYVKAEFAVLEEAIENCDWDTLQEILDVESMIHYIMVQEIIGNVEMDNNPSMRSGYIHRHDSNSKWTMGPLWDCDGGFNYNWGDMYDSRGWGHTFFENYTTLIYGSDPYNHRGAYGSTASDFFCRLWGIPEFVKQFKARWAEVHTSLLNGLLDYLDKVEEIICDAAQEDMQLWKIDNYKHDTEYAKLVKWLKNRFSYLDTVIPNYPEEVSSTGGPSADATVKETLEKEVSFAQDGHHYGATVTLTDQDRNRIEAALGTDLDSFSYLYYDDEAAFWALEPDGGYNSNDTAYAPGHWFDADGYVTTYGQNSYVYSQYSLWEGSFEIGKHPTICTAGSYEIAQVFVYENNAVCIKFHITVTE